MKINNHNATSTSPAEKPAALATPGQNGRARSNSLSFGSPDNLQLSNLSSQLSSLQSNSSHQIARLSSAVVTGQYQVDAKAVSHGLIEEHLRG